MHHAKELYSKIIGIKNTKKITKAMELVAISKMRKTQERMMSSQPYAETIKRVISHFVTGNLEYRHPYLDERKARHIGYIVVATDRGLTGALNINLFKKLLFDMKSWNEKGVKTELALIGSKAVSFFNLLNSKIIAQVTGLGDSPIISKIIGPVKVILQAYDEKKIDKIYIASNKFVNVMSQVPQISQILPVTSIGERELKTKYWDYLYEPDPKTLLDTLLCRYVEYQVYQSVVENIASEQAARMIAMKAATDNGNSLIKELEIISNKIRQSSITKEISEIISGSAAV